MKKLIFLLIMGLAAASCSSKPETGNDYSNIKNLTDLGGQKVSVISGSLQDLLLSDLDPAPELLRYSSPAEVIASVSAGKSDFCVADTTAFICAGAEEKGLKFLLSSTQAAGGYGFAMNKENHALQKELNDFIESIQKNGLMDEIINRWTTGDVNKVIMPQIDMNPDGEKLIVGTMPNFPFTFIQNGKMAGLETEILERFAAKTGRNLEFIELEFSGMIAAISARKIDLASCSMTITEERAKNVLFSTSYYFCKTACYYRNPDAGTSHKSFTDWIKDGVNNNLIVENRWKIIAAGLWETFIISLFSILLGTIFGAFLCWMIMSDKKYIRKPADAFIYIVQGIPILVFLMIFYYVIFTSNSVPPRWVAIIAFSINFGAYSSRMFKSGIAGIDKGQTEAGLAMGFSRIRTFVNFILPQAVKTIIPVYKGEATSLIKGTSIVGYVAIIDITKASDIIRSRTFDAFFPLLIVSIIYFILAGLFSKALDCLSSKKA